LQVDADALAACPNYWVPREVVEGAGPALTAAEQAVAALWRAAAAPPLAELGEAWQGAEYWCQVYEGGRGLGFHFDKDEHAMAAHGRMATPLLSSVLYLTGSPADPVRQASLTAPPLLPSACCACLCYHTSARPQDAQPAAALLPQPQGAFRPAISAPRQAALNVLATPSPRRTHLTLHTHTHNSCPPCQAPTVIIDQRYDHQAGCVLPEHPAWSALVFPARNQYCLFGGAQAHGVLEGMPVYLGEEEEQQQQQSQEQPQQQSQEQPQQQSQEQQQQQSQEQPQQQPQGQQQRRLGQQRRVTFLVNWWARRPENVGRATPQDVAAGKLAAARAELAMHPPDTAGGAAAAALEELSLGGAAADASCRQREAGQPPLRRVDFVTVAAPRLEPGDVLPVRLRPLLAVQQQRPFLHLPWLIALKAGPFPPVWLKPARHQPSTHTPTRPPSLLQIDDLLQQRHVHVSGGGSSTADAVLVSHPGLSLVPLDEAAVDPRTPLQVLAALLPTADLGSDSEDGGGGGSGSDA
jgi:hypothetical protein